MGVVEDINKWKSKITKQDVVKAGMTLSLTMLIVLYPLIVVVIDVIVPSLQGFETVVDYFEQTGYFENDDLSVEQRDNILLFFIVYALGAMAVILVLYYWTSWTVTWIIDQITKRIKWFNKQV